MRSEKTDIPDLSPTARDIANAVETLTNVLYLIDRSLDSPEAIKTYLLISEPAVEILRMAAFTAQFWQPSDEQVDVRSEPTAAGEGLSSPATSDDSQPLSQDGSAPESRIDRLEAD